MESFVTLKSLGKTTLPGRLDVMQALSGVVLAVFTIIHLILTSTVIISPRLMGGIGWILEELYLAQVFGPIILLLVIFHFILAARKMPFLTGGLKVYWEHAKSMRHQYTWEWFAQVISAIIVLVFSIIHMSEILSTLPITVEKSALREQHGWTPFYIVLLTAVGIHLSLGLFRVCVKYGYITAENRAVWQKRIYILLAAYIGLGLLTIIRFHFITIPN
ncbi:hypothetical protein [Desulfovibrio litoralis]|uniref:Succinate dehydrogenase subunit C n=1 Tax=Desulfovibrio litoralis DSM 11393 TaxID=1121455 RepID=A0A1M7RR78_9BACT|nr:hypothetical protein [Desulfovibrio litoralis]SHN48606.1 succinate dehydrogenase subunit C [Desulfovibrio litoralis DSM 11393]